VGVAFGLGVEVGLGDSEPPQEKISALRIKIKYLINRNSQKE
jgi:hypothetical protein